MLGVLASMAVTAGEVTEQEALQKARQFMQGKRFKQKTLRRAPAAVAQQNAYYVFNAEDNDGFVIVAGDDRMPAILGYSYNGGLDVSKAPGNLKALLRVYEGQVEFLRAHPETKVGNGAAIVGSAIDALVDCRWGQGEPYNGACPILNETRTYTGCLATAMAQVMYCHQWPLQTTKIIPAYTTTSFGIAVEDMPVTAIDWNNMINEYTENNYTAEQATAVATLMSLCGAAVHMDYCDFVSGSTMDQAEEALTDYFGYSNNLMRISTAGYDQEEWNETIYQELSCGRPVLYSGANSFWQGHAFVVDGYDGNGYFHVNLGWAEQTGTEMTEGFYLLSDVEGYSIAQEAIIGVQKPDKEAKEAYGILDDKGVMTLYYDRQKDSRTGTICSPVKSLSGNNDMQECVIDPSFADYPLGTLLGYFHNCTNLKKVTGLKFLNSAHVTDMSYMFMGCTSLENLDLSGFNTSKVRSMYGMFHECSSLKSLDVSSFDTRSVQDMGCMFRYCDNLESLDVTNFNTENVNSMGNMFDRCASLTSLDLSHFNTANVELFGSMFRQCTALKKLDLSNFDTSKATTMTEMFQYCEALEELDVSSFNTANVTSMSYMFQCGSLKKLDLRNFNTEKVTDMEEMFRGCSTLTSLDISSFNTQNVTSMKWMFSAMGDRSPLRIYVGDGWSTANVENGEEMFLYCDNLRGSKGTQCRDGMSGMEYARIDGGPDNPGYFSDGKALVEISPVAESEDVSFAEGLTGDTSLKHTAIGNVYYNMDASNGDGYDATEQAVVLNTTTTEDNMNAVVDAYLSDDAVQEGYHGIILKVTEGKGTITLDAKTVGTHVLNVQIGNEEPVKVSKTERGMVNIYYEVTEPTYVYLYAGTDDGAAARSHHAPSAAVNSVLLYGYSLLVGTFLGDANGDGSVTITDAVAVVDYILGNPPADFVSGAADISKDGTISITDAVGIVDVILSK